MRSFSVRKDRPEPSIAIVGPGRLGQAIGRLLTEEGQAVTFIAGRNLTTARRAARFIGQGTPCSLTDPRLHNASVLLLTTSDSAIAEVALQVAQQGEGTDSLRGKNDLWRGKVVFHTCGSLPSAILTPFQLRGAAIGSLHPYQTVPNPQAGVRNLRGAFWGLEGDARALSVARNWVKLLGGTAFPLRPDAKTLYHLSAFMVSPTVVTLMAESASLLKQAGMPQRIARPMLRQFVAETARNFEQLGGRRALTGPAVRGDWATIRRHLQALRQAAPEFVAVYRILLAAMLRLAGAERPTPVNSKGKPNRKRADGGRQRG